MKHTAQPQRSTTNIIPRIVNIALVTAALAAALICTTLVQAQTYDRLHRFHGAEGTNLRGGLTGDANGHLYGIAKNGGDFGVGTIYAMKIATKRVVALHSMQYVEGEEAVGELVRDAMGNLYGAARSGGLHSCGTVFKLDTKLVLTVLHTFIDSPEGCNPWGRLVIDSGGNLYGTTYAGGQSRWGTVYKLDPAGVLTVLHSFSVSDGIGPEGGLLLHAGYLYGVTTGAGLYGYGTIFRVQIATGATTTLHSFEGTEGMDPDAALIRDAAGNIYGTTVDGGAYNKGVIFRLDRTGVLTTLYSFTGGEDGGSPRATLVLDAAGNLYGATPYGGMHGVGTVFRFDPNGTETVLYSFDNIDGSPNGNLYMDAGILYGTTGNWIFSVTP
ncbi:MAG TPA: choice-of-anchor tandem repeat GloVer-containing protein [Terriglobales bacterium]|jgi:uncharacterized repeat protein (TIGR03803 family)